MAAMGDRHIFEKYFTSLIGSITMCPALILQRIFLMMKLFPLWYDSFDPYDKDLLIYYCDIM